ncbi:hypothetical protein QYE76_019105 [Lolium multiflorum]|uniref:Uncharacterized protein n=1 Tax=Lolium multiflorum TaxID=4521 RepID=A0AAD8R6C6_LOLMU|nr:hypothetical protein QYE76_019105 [Lolium multiflorum]
MMEDNEEEEEDDDKYPNYGDTATGHEEDEEAGGGEDEEASDVPIDDDLRRAIVDAHREAETENEKRKLKGMLDDHKKSYTQIAKMAKLGATGVAAMEGRGCCPNWAARPAVGRLSCAAPPRRAAASSRGAPLRPARRRRRPADLLCERPRAPPHRHALPPRIHRCAATVARRHQRATSAFFSDPAAGKESLHTMRARPRPGARTILERSGDGEVGTGLRRGSREVLSSGARTLVWNPDPVVYPDILWWRSRGPRSFQREPAY